MHIQNLHVRNLRCLQDVQLELNSGVNVLVGDNAAGKTTILESIEILGLGRSHRCPRLRTAISHDQTICHVVGDVIEGARKQRLGIEVGGEKLRAKIDGEKIDRLSDLASALAVILVNRDVSQLIDGSPSHRRQLLDWLLFHVEPLFFQNWQQFRRALGQRNAVLRSHTTAGLPQWDQLFLEFGLVLHHQRQTMIDQLSPQLANSWQHFADFGDAELNYRQGWAKDHSLQQALTLSLESDLSQQRTSRGPQRADMLLSINGHSAKEILSRGQKQCLGLALSLAQLNLVADDVKPVWLIDDFGNELDQLALSRLIQAVSDYDGQVLIATHRTDIQQLLNNAKVFHVEHGTVSEP